MRVLMLADGYPPVVGGLELYVQRLSQELTRRGHHVSVVTLQTDGACGREEEEEDSGVRVYRLRGAVHALAGLNVDPSRVFAPPLPDPVLLQGLRQVLGREQPELVHAHSWLVHSFIPLKKWSNASLVVTLHDYSLACANKGLMSHGVPCAGPGFARCIACAIHHFGLARGLPIVLGNAGMGVVERNVVDVFLPVSKAVAEGNGLSSNGLAYEVIPNFVVDDEHRGVSHAENLPAELPRDDYLLFVGAFERSKGVHVLVDAYASLVDPPPLVLIGARRTDMPLHLPAGVVMFTSWPHRAVLHAFQRSLLAIVPSVWPEPCPTVVLEAMAAGRAVVASSVGGIPELVVDGETGLLVPAGDVSALCRALRQMLDDPTLRHRMGAAARKRVEQFHADRVVPRIERVYQQVRSGQRCAA